MILVALLIVTAGAAAVAAVGSGPIASEAASDSKAFSLDKPVGDKYSQYLFTGLKDELSAMIGGSDPNALKKLRKPERLAKRA
jgi:hypothetical protein